MRDAKGALATGAKCDATAADKCGDGLACKDKKCAAAPAAPAANATNLPVGSPCTNTTSKQCDAATGACCELKTGDTVFATQCVPTANKGAKMKVGDKEYAVNCVAGAVTKAVSAAAALVLASQLL